MSSRKSVERDLRSIDKIRQAQLEWVFDKNLLYEPTDGIAWAAPEVQLQVDEVTLHILYHNVKKSFAIDPVSDAVYKASRDLAELGHSYNTPEQLAQDPEFLPRIRENLQAGLAELEKCVNEVKNLQHEKPQTELLQELEKAMWGTDSSIRDRYEALQWPTHDPTVDVREKKPKKRRKK